MSVRNNSSVEKTRKKNQPIRTREIGDVRLFKELYVIASQPRGWVNKI